MNWSILRKIPNEPFLGEKQAKGTHLIAGELAQAYWNLQVEFMSLAQGFGCVPVILPTIEPAKVYTDKAGPEVAGQMYVFKDKGNRDLCLRPEATATCQLLAQNVYKTYSNLKLCYWQKCFRYEQPQAGRYREFTQFGVEVLNPKKDWTDELISLAHCMIKIALGETVQSTDAKGIVPEINRGVKRGLGIYTDEGFEISIAQLGAQKQVAGGGPYENGQGFAIGIDRLLCVDGVVERWGQPQYVTHLTVKA